MPFNAILWQRMPPLTGAFTSSRIFLYTLFSLIATITTVANACRSHSNFYSVAIYLSRSGRSLLVLANFGFLCALLSGRVLQHVFFGPLQSREVERLYDQTWMFVTESLLAFTIFRDDFDIPFVIMFGFLLFIKCFHWLMADRVESMDQVPFPGPSTLFHIRMNSLFLILALVDFVMLGFAIDSTLNTGVSGMVIFANEYAILMASALNSVARYTLSVLELRRARSRGGANAPAWENKSMYVFYIELVTDFLKLSTYLTFFVIVLAFYGLPLNMIRDVYLTARSFTTRLRALVRYHNATRDMDRRYPNATEEELTAMSDRTCIICREEMVAPPQNQNPPVPGQPPANANTTQDGPNVTPKKLPCGHIFHFQCLRSWLERQQSCPTCRRTVLETDQPNRTNGRAAARNANARPGVPQPGGVPAMGQAGQPNPNLGWLGRVLGLAAPPPLVPGQVPPAFAQPGVAGGQPLPGNAGWPAPGQQLPPGYLYPYPYQLPPQQLQPPPVYRGFYGPGGAWQPWGVDAQGMQGQNGPAQPQQTDQHPSSSSVPTSTQPPASSPSAANTFTSSTAQNAPVASSATTVPQRTGSSTASGTSEEGSSSSDDARPATPRDAAALAALRRLNLPPTGSVPDSRTSAAPQPASSSSGSVPADTSQRAPPAPSQTLPPTTQSSASSSTSSSSTSTAAPVNHVEIPPLIPLYDLRQYQIPLPGLPAYVQQPYLRHPLQTQQAPLAARSTGFAQVRGAGQDSRQRPTAARGPLSQLPPTLTDEQLSRLDRLTREAIDERLRVLEGVSGAVYRCIEELTRMRSVLPPREPAGHGGSSAASQASSASEATSSTPPVSGPNKVTAVQADEDASSSSGAESSTAPRQHDTQSSRSDDLTSADERERPLDAFD